MTINLRRGFKRIALVYFALWVLVGVLGFIGQRDAETQFLRVSRADTKFERTAELAAWNDQMQFAGKLIEAAILMGLIVPIVTAIVGAVGWWIYRGFREKTPRA